MYRERGREIERDRERDIACDESIVCLSLFMTRHNITAPCVTSPPTAMVFRPIGHTRNKAQYITNWLLNDIGDDT